MIAKVRFIWRDALSLLYALRDPRTPTQAKWITALAVLYAVSPVDLLPDLTPLLGFGDDVLVVPTLLALAARSLPGPVLADARARSLRVQRALPWLLPTLAGVFVLGAVLTVWGLARALS